MDIIEYLVIDAYGATAERLSPLEGATAERLSSLH